MQINQIQSYNFSKLNGCNCPRKPVSNNISFGDKMAVKDTNDIPKIKSDDIQELVIDARKIYKTTQKSAKYVYADAKNILKKGAKVNYQNYAVEVSDKDNGDLKAIYGKMTEKGFPESASYVDKSLKVRERYEFDLANEDALAMVKMTEYTDDYAGEYLIYNGRFFGYSEVGKGETIEKSILPTSHGGFVYTETDISNENDPKILLTLTVDGSGKSGRYLEEKDGKTRAYVYNAKTKTWEREKALDVKA